MAHFRLKYDLSEVGLRMEANDYIKLGRNTTTNEDIVIKIGDFTDAADSGVAPGSLGLDISDGLLFVSDTNGVWQVVTV